MASKKQILVALSTIEAKYMTTGNFYGINLNHYLSNAINLLKNLIQHSRTKHIEIRHYFLIDHVQKGGIALELVSTEIQLANIFTKHLCKE